MTERVELKPLKRIMAASIADDIKGVLDRMYAYQKMQPTSGVSDSISKLEKVHRRMVQED